MTPESGKSLESIEEITERTRSQLIEEEQGDAALDRLIEEIGEQPKPQPTPEPRGPAESEFTCRGCHLIFSRSCLADSARVLCKDCAALADARTPACETRAPSLSSVRGAPDGAGTRGSLVRVRLPRMSSPPHQARRPLAPRVEPP